MRSGKQRGSVDEHHVQGKKKKKKRKRKRKRMSKRKRKKKTNREFAGK